MVAGRPIKDIDLVVDLPNGGIRLAEYLKAQGHTTDTLVIYENFGTVMFRLKEFPDEELEAVMTRSECYRDSESRNPDTAFGTIMEDCTRRDFTYNALYYSISDGEIKDFNGKSLEDLQNNYLRTCGDPDIIFTEDPLRILRAIRFACRYESIIDDATMKGMKKYADRLSIISQERITAEFDKIIMSDYPEYGLDLIRKIGAMRHVFPIPEDVADPTYEAIPAIRSKMDDFPLEKEHSVRMAVLFGFNFFLSDDDIRSIMVNMKYPTAFIDEVIFLRKHKDTLFYNIADIPIYRKLQYECAHFKHHENADMLFTKLIHAACLDKIGGFRMAKNAEEIFTMMKETKRDFLNYRLPLEPLKMMEIYGEKPSSKTAKLINHLVFAATIDPFITEEGCIEIILKLKRDKMYD